MNETAVAIILPVTAAVCAALCGFVLGLWSRVRFLESDMEKVKKQIFDKKTRIECAPTKDLVEVVRCRDCKYSITLFAHCNSDGADMPFLVCKRHQAMSIGGKSYCDSGERRENDETN